MRGQRCYILGVPVDVLTLEEAVQRAETMLADGGTHLVVTPNAEMLNLAGRDPGFKGVLCRADLILPDGAGVVLVGRIKGIGKLVRVPGVDFVRGLLGRGRPSVFLLGGAPGVAELAAIGLRGVNPLLEVRGTAHGYFTAEEETVLVEAIRSSGAEILLAGLGVPKQEKWLAKHLDRLGVGLAVGVGGALDIFAGQAARCPPWLGRIGLEWLYRLVREPRRAGRMLALPQFVWAALRERA